MKSKESLDNMKIPLADREMIPVIDDYCENFYGHKNWIYITQSNKKKIQKYERKFLGERERKYFFFFKENA